MDKERFTCVLNTPCLLTSHGNLTHAIEQHCKSNGNTETLSIDFTNVHIVTMRTMDAEFHESTSSVDWFVPDSQILTWAVSLLGGDKHCRVYGPDFLAYFLSHADTRLSHAFVGGSQECVDLLCSKMQEIKPDIKIAYSHHGYFDERHEQDIIDSINDSNAEILWVGLGTPKQQQWIHRNKHRLKTSAILAVGFAFDVNAGTKKDSPSWLGPLGLTWLYRLLREPRRLWKRYLVYNTVFLIKLLKQIRSGTPSERPRSYI